MNECLMTAQHEKQIDYWVSERDNANEMVIKLKIEKSSKRSSHWSSAYILRHEELNTQILQLQHGQMELWHGSYHSKTNVIISSNNVRS